MLPRFYQPTITPVQGTITLDDANIIHQITKVLRLKKNDIFIIFSPHYEYEVTIKTLTQKTIELTVLEKRQTNREPSKQLIIYQSLLKKDNFEWVLQKGTELGVQSFVPIVTHNSIVRKITDTKLKRYQKILTEATEQCGGKQPPALHQLLTFEQAITKSAGQDGQKIIAWEGESGNNLTKKIHSGQPCYHLFIGPEGGFSPEEIKLAANNGFTAVSLGKRILRAETAAIAAASLILLS